MAEITLYNQDCIAAMKQIDAESIDLIVTDPPYNLGNFMKKRDTNLKKMRDNFFGSAGWDDMEFDEWSKSMDEFFKASARVIKKGLHFFLGDGFFARGIDRNLIRVKK